MIARGLLFPGSLPRKDALVIYGAQGVRLALGIIPMLFVAGIVEAFVSPSPLMPALKFVFAAGLFGLFVLYVMRGGREESDIATRS